MGSASPADSTDSAHARIFDNGRLGTEFGDDVQGRFDVTELTADLRFRFGPFSALTDYYWAEADPNLGTGKQAWGYNLQAGCLILPKRLEAVARYSYVDRNRDVDDDGLREIGGGLNYFIYGHNLKLQADIRSLRDESSSTGDSVEYRLQLQGLL